MKTNLPLLFAGLVLVAQPALAQEPRAIAFNGNIDIETGDTWRHLGQRYRLYGVQSCIRGTAFQNKDGHASDCGARSLASLAALFSTGTVACQPVGYSNENGTFVVCAADLDGKPVDVGTAMIASGNAFAAIFPDGSPVTSQYLVAELTAKAHAAGLWVGQFSHPVALLLGNSVKFQ